MHPPKTSIQGASADIAGSRLVGRSFHESLAICISPELFLFYNSIEVLAWVGVNKLNYPTRL